MLKLFEKNGLVYRFQKAEGQSKGIIVFIHGFATTSEYHDPFAKQLKDYDYYTFELPGHGFTKLVDKKQLSPKAYVDIVIDWIKSMKFEKINLIGHSMGGGIVGMIATRIPELINKLVMVTPMNSSFSFKLANVFKFVPKNDKQTYEVQKFLYKDAHKFFPEHEDNKLIKKETEYQLKHRSNFKTLRSNMSSLSFRSFLRKSEKNIKVKTLLILGKHDGIIDWKPANKKFSKYDNFTIKVFNDSGHLPFIEESVLYFNTIMEFIKSE